MRRLYFVWGVLAAVVLAIDSAAGDVSGNKDGVDESMLSSFASQLQAAQAATQQDGGAQQQGAIEQLQQSVAQQQQQLLSTSQRSSSLLTGATSGSAEAGSDAEASGGCHPQCSWKCDTPVCNQVRVIAILSALRQRR